MQHETFYAVTATVAPVLFIAFVLEIRVNPRLRLRKHAWYLMIWNAIYYGVVFIAIELISLLILAGTIHDTTEWRVLLILFSMLFTIALAANAIARVVMDGYEATQAKQNESPPITP